MPQVWICSHCHLVVYEAEDYVCDAQAGYVGAPERRRHARCALENPEPVVSAWRRVIRPGDPDDGPDPA